jgi:acyl-CoA synthetase (AMP-forming)/AMP-acid ligase II
MFHFASVYEAIAAQQPDDAALIHGDDVVSWREFDARADAMASWMCEVGLRPGASVALYLWNGPEYLVAQHAAFKVGAVPVNVNYRYLAAELTHLLRDCGAEIVVHHASLADRVAAVRPQLADVRAWVEVDDAGSPSSALRWDAVLAAHRGRTPPQARVAARSEDGRYVLYTGGTTGLPKGVEFRMGDFVQRMLTGFAYRGWAMPATVEGLLRETAAHRAAGDRRVSIAACPLMHGTGMWLGAMYAHMMGGSAVTLESRRFDAAELWRAVARHGADAVTIVGDAFARPMLDALDRAEAAGSPYDTSTMRIVQSSGVMFSAEVQRGLLRHMDIRIVDSMGSTEGAMARRIATRATPIETARFEPLPGTVVVDEELRVIPPGTGVAGRVAGSRYVPIGYRHDPVKTAATFVEIDGVRHTMAGDWVLQHADGSLTLLGRGSGCINTGGEKVFPEEVEEALKRHAAVHDTLVVGVPDSRFGASVAAVVALSPGSADDPQVLIEHVRNELAHYKAPRRIVIVDEVRRAPNGKADYAWAAEVAAAAPPPG